MIEYVIILLILSWLNSFMIIGIYTAAHYNTHEGAVVDEGKMVLWRVRYTIERYLGNFWAKPIITCPPCMASFHSIIPYSLFVAYTGVWWMMFGLLLYIPTVSGITKYLHTKIESL